AVYAFMARRAPGRHAWSTARRETDMPVILSGLVNGRTCGAALSVMLENRDADSQAYEAIRFLPRPSHADYPAWVKTGGEHDVRGGGQYSGRLTAPLVFAGAVCAQLLARRNIEVGAHLAAVAGIEDRAFDPVGLTSEQLGAAAKKEFPVLDDAAGERMRQAIEQARAELDSVGGVIECAALGLPAGLGDPMFDGLENRLAAMIFGIPAVRGIEFGAGFSAAAMRGSAHNDPYFVDKEAIRARTNHAGGVLGGMATGMPLLLRVAVKPTASIARPQQTVDLQTRTDAVLTLQGRHDPCIAPRAVPCVEAAVAFTLLDLLLEGR
ncbi:MAG: chorismate synthase, partial [Oscillospiraceae bacterium]